MTKGRSIERGSKTLYMAVHWNVTKEDLFSMGETFSVADGNLYFFCFHRANI